MLRFGKIFLNLCVREFQNWIVFKNGLDINGTKKCQLWHKVEKVKKVPGEELLYLYIAHYYGMLSTLECIEIGRCFVNWRARENGQWNYENMALKYC